MRLRVDLVFPPPVRYFRCPVHNQNPSSRTAIAAYKPNQGLFCATTAGLLDGKYL